MRTILITIPRLSPADWAYGQLRTLASRLTSDGRRFVLAVLSGNDAFATPFRQAGWTIETLGWRRRLDLSAAARLAVLARALKPNVVHLWQPTHTVLAVMQAAYRAEHVYASLPFVIPSCQPPAVERWFWRGVDRVILEAPGDLDECRRRGIEEARTTILPPAIDGVVPTDGGPVPGMPVIPTSARLILACAGESGLDAKDAVWAMGIVRYLDANLQLLVTGTGVATPGLRAFARGTGVAERVHFAPEEVSVASLLPRCDLAWVVSRRERARHDALTSMGAGKPVIGLRQPALLEFIHDGETGYLFDSGDKVTLAKKTRALLDDEALRLRLGDAGRQLVHSHHAPDAMAARHDALYG